MISAQVLTTDTIHLTKLTMLATKHNPETEPCSTEISHSLHPQLTERSAPGAGLLCESPRRGWSILVLNATTRPRRAYEALTAKPPSVSIAIARLEYGFSDTATPPLTLTGYSNATPIPHLHPLLKCEPLISSGSQGSRPRVASPSY